MKEKKSCRLTTEEAIATVSDKNPDFAKELLENYKALIRRRCNGCPYDCGAKGCSKQGVVDCYETDREFLLQNGIDIYATTEDK